MEIAGAFEHLNAGDRCVEGVPTRHGFSCRGDDPQDEDDSRHLDSDAFGEAGFSRREAPGDGPLVVDFQHRNADEADDRIVVGEDTDIPRIDIRPHRKIDVPDQAAASASRTPTRAAGEPAGTTVLLASGWLVSGAT